MRLLGRDEFTGIDTYFEHDSATGKNIYKEVQDIEPIIEANKHITLNKAEEWWKIGSIPMTTLHGWAHQAGVRMWSKEFNEVVRKNMNLPDYRAFNPNKVKI